MMNAIDIYQDAGTKHARAVNVGDGPCAWSWYQWLGQALALEQGAEKQQARDAYSAAYIQARTI